MASGQTDFASIKNIKVIRRNIDGNKSYILDLSKKDIYNSEAFFLQPNDYVIVHPDRYKNFQLNSQAYSLFFSSISIMLAVLGFATR
jgi:polysaccharide export outer membrane protein